MKWILIVFAMLAMTGCASRNRMKDPWVRQTPEQKVAPAQQPKATIPISECPKCQKPTKRVILHSFSTTNPTQVWVDEDGKVHIIDPNVITVYYQCQECGTEFKASGRRQ